MAASREVDILNYSTPRSEKIELSEDGHPLIWLDTDLDRRNKNYLTPVGGMLAGLKSVEPPVIRPTGRTRKMHAATGGERGCGSGTVAFRGGFGEDLLLLSGN